MDDNKFKNLYRIPSARLASWDYGSNAAYFVTICTQNRVHLFGAVRDGQMVLTPLGEAAYECWYAIPEHFPFVLLGGFVAMPNHVHGIIIIAKPVETQDFASLPPSSDSPSVETQDFASPHFASLPPANKFGPQSQNLASIVRGYKIGVTKFARQNDIAFAWQSRYHDHIIRNAEEYDRISKYIVENPQKWSDDRYHPEQG